MYTRGDIVYFDLIPSGPTIECAFVLILPNGDYELKPIDPNKAPNNLTGSFYISPDRVYTYGPTSLLPVGLSPAVLSNYESLWGNVDTLTELYKGTGSIIRYTPKECECGQKGVEWAKHSSYCPLYEKETL